MKASLPPVRSAPPERAAPPSSVTTAPARSSLNQTAAGPARVRAGRAPEPDASAPSVSVTAPAASAPPVQATAPARLFQVAPPAALRHDDTLPTMPPERRAADADEVDIDVDDAPASEPERWTREAAALAAAQPTRAALLLAFRARAALDAGAPDAAEQALARAPSWPATRASWR